MLIAGNVGGMTRRAFHKTSSALSGSTTSSAPKLHGQSLRNLYRNANRAHCNFRVARKYVISKKDFISGFYDISAITFYDAVFPVADLSATLV